MSGYHEHRRAVGADWLLDAGEPAAPALRHGDRTIDRDELRALVLRRVDELDLPERSLVVLAGATGPEFVVTHLALLHAGHVPLLAPPDPSRLVATWRPSAVVVAHDDGVHIEHDRDAHHDLHHDLALLMSTSGSTGSPKLVRLSHHNIRSNATAIVDSLRLTPEDVAITTLPLHYCYGLSVLHSHLAAGASIVLQRASVVDPCFGRALRRHGVTNVAGVPHTFELLERVGADRLRVPSLRFVTQAGGRLHPDLVRTWARRTAAWGAEFVVMYGQTEATARMAYLPSHLAASYPDAIGVAIPGGELRIRDADDHGVGELVYRGPNVMLGYATTPTDLAAGRTIDELHTGDLARRSPDTGLFSIAGRSARFVKPFGVRIDLDDVEGHLRVAGVSRAPGRDVGATAATAATVASTATATTAAGAATTGIVDDLAVAGDDGGIVVIGPHLDPVATLATTARSTGLPAHAIHVVVADVPRTERGKVASAAVLAMRPAAAPPPARDAAAAEVDGPDVIAGHDAPTGTVPAEVVADVFRAVLGVDEVRPDDSFVSLGGDSLSYVECSLRLERVLGTLPADWHHLRLADFPAPRRRTWLRRTDTTVLLRAVGILAVVATHMGVRHVPGGAHLMLAVVGYNVSRFVLDVEPWRDRWRAGLRSLARVVVPTITWALGGLVLAGSAYGVGTLLLVNNYVGPASHAGDHWHFWFVEVLVHLTLIALLLSGVPVVRRLDRRHPYLAPLALLGVALVLRMPWAWLGDWYNLRFRTHGVAWFFVLGWLVHRSTTWRTRLATTLLAMASIPGFFQVAARERFILAGVVLLIWCRQVPLPRPVVVPIAALSAASLWIFITHFTVWPPLDRALDRELAYVLTLAAGIGIWLIARRGEAALRRAVRLRGSSRRAARTRHRACSHPRPARSGTG